MLSKKNHGLYNVIYDAANLSSIAYTNSSAYIISEKIDWWELWLSK